MRISVDLDNVIFDIEPLYRRANAEFNVPYRVPGYWDVDKCYPKNVTERLLELFASDALYTMPLISPEYPAILNNLMRAPHHDVFFVTQRRLSQPQKSYRQLRDAGINCLFPQVYDQTCPKVDVLRELNIDLHLDDSPNVVADCMRAGVRVAMISNDKTPYNHFLRGQINHYQDLKTALVRTGILGVMGR